MPGNDIDVYLEPLINELKQLWVGVETYDAVEKKTFKMYATLMWTISDFPGLGKLSGWNTKDQYSFDGKIKNRGLPVKFSSGDIVRQLEGVHVQLGKKKRSIFFELPYWENNGLRHNLDVMHIDKNVCDNIVFTILNEKDLRQRKLSGLKSHDCHILMEHLLPIALRNAFPAPVSSVLVDLSSFFRQLCSKSIDSQKLSLLQDHVVHTLCHMKMIFPPSFFTVMVHLTVHLVEKVRLGGPVHYRWMYHIERSQPEGSIAEGYLSEEILIFCARYLDNVESRINRPMRVDDRLRDLMPDESATMYPEVGKAVGAAFFTLAHQLKNSKLIVIDFRAITKRKLRSRTRSQSHIDNVVHRKFSEWFKREVLLGSIMHPNQLQLLACGPNVQASRLTSYNINGFKFKTLSREKGLKTQNSRVYVTFDTRSYASKHDSNAAVGSISGIKQDSLGHTLVNFSHPIHTGDQEDDEPYIIASEARLVYYVDNEVDKEWSIVVHVNPRDMFDMGEDIGQYHFKLFPQPILTGLSEFDFEGLSLRRDNDLEESA
ncbi:uncharacterized protein LOC107615464 [Arachis ipaensis]|uniref:uncharacterized protein LOC107615464 n=1 Tax=Arachis ipaensis TaxID=130454 RepID=UPI0007AF053C|nr:uncharacterized protein LOC107615464 [Arachis ipaensis]XP_025678466.1 uncharacterized protein LOC112778355 [Arachis hypogaea]